MARAAQSAVRVPAHARSAELLKATRLMRLK